MNITNKLWSFCHILRHDGMDYADYVEQLTYLLFLKMADESEIIVPAGCHWQEMLNLSGEELTSFYERALNTLKKEPGILGQIFQEPISKIKNPSNLKKIIDGIEEIGWTKLGKDVQGEAFEGLLEKTANEGKKGAGQFFTPRPLIQAMVNVMKPNPLEHSDFRIADVACGTSGFLTVAADWAKEHLKDRKLSANQQLRVRKQAYYGQELVVRPYRLGLMNMFLHGIDANITLGDSIYNQEVTSENWDCILTNPPFGSRGAIGIPKHRSFRVETSNIQINFIQHIFETLRPQGRAAIVLPDSALTDSKAKEVWQILIGEQLCNVHTILKLPNGTFNPYATGVKACVIFMQKGVKTENIWLFDARRDVEEVTKSSRPLDYQKHFANFVECYGKDPNGQSKRKVTNRFEKFTIDDIKEAKYDLSFNKLFIPNEMEPPVHYVDRLIDNFEQQVRELYRLKELL